MCARSGEEVTRGFNRWVVATCSIDHPINLVLLKFLRFPIRQRLGMLEPCDILSD